VLIQTVNAQTTTTATTCNVTANAGPDIILCPGNTATLNGTATANTTTTTTTVAATTSSVYSTSVPTTHGWTFSDTRWSRVTTNLAGGAAAGEFRFQYSSTATSTFTATSPLITGNFSGMTMSFRHFLDNYNATSYPYTLSLQTSTDGVTWTNRWSVTPTGTANIAASTVSGIDLSALSNTNFYIRFNFTGNTFGVDFWYIDDIAITGYANTITSSSTPLAATYSWTPVSTITSGATTLTPTVAPAASTNYILTVTAASCFARDTALVTILNLTTNAGPDIGVCNGSSVVLNGTATANPASIASTTVSQVYNTSVPTTHGWTFSDARWSRVTTNLAGGTSGEFRFYYSASATGTYTATSPAINASAYSGLTLSFRHYLNNFNGTTYPYTLAVQTSTDGINWTNRWSANPTASIPASTVNGVDLSMLSGTTFYLRLTFSGQESGINGWYVDDININGYSTVFINPAYSWTPAASITSGATSLTPTVAPTATTNYVLISSASGCTSKDTVKVAVLGVNAGADVTACQGNSVSLTGSSTTATIQVPTTTTTSSTVNGTVYNTPVPTTHGWTFSDTRWSQVATNLAGGAAAGEFRFYYSSSATGTYTATSPAINASSYNALTLSFRHYVNNFNGSSYPYTLSVQTSTDGTTWTNRWSVSPTASISATTVSGVDLSALNGTTFYIRLNFTGQEFGIYGWYIDDITVSGTTTVNTSTTTYTTVPVTYSWASPATITNGSTTLTPTVAPSSTTTYVLTGTAGSCTTTDDIVVTLPVPSGNLANTAENATCIVKAGETVHFYNTVTGNYITSVTAGATALGSTTATVYVDGAVDLVPACDNTSYETAVLQRHWVITPTIQGPASVRLPYSTLELANLAATSATSSNISDLVIDQSNLMLSKYSGDYTPFDAVMTNINVDADPDNNCTAAGGTGLTVLINQIISGSGASSCSSALYSDFNISSFSEFWLHGSDNSSPLPVEVSSFTVKCEETNQLVEWTTEAEIHCDHFELERSRDGYNWELVASLPGHGTTQEKQYYSSVQDLTEEVVYFRLKEVDTDGSSKTFDAIPGNCSVNTNNLSVFPNPAAYHFTVSVSSEKRYPDAEIQIMELSGKSLYKKSADLESGMSHLYFDGLNLTSGTYIISVITEDSIFLPIKLVIQ
jgi:hypothetical protein